MRLRKWGFPVLRTWANLDPIQHLGDPDEAPEPTMTGTGVADPDGPPEVEILDVPPEIRPWDVAKDAEHPPHCDGRHGDGHPTRLGTSHRCEYCDALADAITALKRAEKRIGDLETAVGALIDDVGRLGGEARQ